MKKITWEETIKSLIKASYLAVLFLVPLLFSFGYEIYNVFTLPKLEAFKILTVLLWFFTLLRFVFFKKIILPKFKVLIAPLALILVLFLASLFSSFSNLSFLGDYYRGQGFFFYLFLFAFFLGLVVNILNFKHKKRVIKEIILTLIIGSVLVSIYAVLQILGIDFITWPEPPFLTKRTFSFLGQPNFLGLYLLLVLPLPFYFLKKKNKFLINIFFCLIILLNLTALYFTSSRSAWIGALLILLLSPLIFLKKEKNKKVLKFSFSILIVLSLFASFLYTNNEFFQKRISSSFNLKEGSVALRIKYWKSALKGIQEKPVLGYGLDSQKEVLIKSYDKEYSALEEINSYTNRAHNYILDILLTAGILGLLAYIFFYFKLIKLASNSGVLGKIFLVSILGYLVALMFLFEIIVTQILIWSFLAILIVREDKFSSKEISYNLKSFTKLLIIILLIFTSFLITKKEVNKLQADHFYNQMINAFNNQEYFPALVLYEYTINKNSQENFYLNSFIEKSFLNKDNFTNRATRETFKTYVKETLEKIENYNDFDSKVAKARAISYLGNHNTSEEHFKELLEVNDSIPFLHANLAYIYNRNNQEEKALKYLDKAINLLPKTDSPLLNTPHRQELKKYLSGLYVDKGKIYLQEKKYNLAISNYERAWFLNAENINIYKSLADCYYLKGDISKAIWYNEIARERDPNTPQWWINLSALYKETGEEEKSEVYWEKAQQLKK